MSSTRPLPLESVFIGRSFRLQPRAMSSPPMMPGAKRRRVSSSAETCQDLLPEPNSPPRPRSIRVQREFGTLQTLIDNRILQVQTVTLSRRRRLPAHGLHCFKALTIQRFTWREPDHPPTRFLRIQETLNADQRVCPAGSSLSRFGPMRRRRHARLGITDWTISTVPPG